MRGLMICTHPILWGDKIEKNELGGACSAYGVGACIEFCFCCLREGDYWGDPNVEGRLILR
jgi:hypothetical protein